MNQIHSLGEAKYPLDFYSATNLQIPWSYKELDTAPDLTPGTFHLITFSRVAFNRGHTEALFAFFDACAFSQCGHGGYVEAKKEAGNKWVFRPVGCVVVS